MMGSSWLSEITTGKLSSMKIGMMTSRGDQMNETGIRKCCNSI
jgi:hypothetical protein